MVTLILDGHHPGLRDWLLQRATAVIMASYCLVLIALILLLQPSHYEAWKSLMAPQWLRFMTLLFLLSLYMHAWLGVKNVLIDYIKPKWLRLMLKAATVFALLLYIVWSVRILWGF
ncbi:MAG TPA: succinate dehydrogenase, hydrophobic membrane anchor protein [Methylophilaceae bacterium]|nr:succinate dehydrogenase, hydrophobic membrane anchor protein [Methylophilaceae bacterium]